jgi:hypothetical protein
MDEKTIREIIRKDRENQLWGNSKGKTGISLPMVTKIAFEETTTEIPFEDLAYILNFRIEFAKQLGTFLVE